MKAIAVLAFLVIAVPAAGQERKAAKPAAHAKPTPQQIRKFNELEKKEKQKKKPASART